MAVRLLVIQHGWDDPPGPLGEWLTDAGLALDVRRPYEGDALPADLSGHAGLLVLGGAMGAGRRRAGAVAARGAPVAAFGGGRRGADPGHLPGRPAARAGQRRARSSRTPQGPEIGAQLVAKRSAAAGDPLFGPLPIMPDVIQWHFDAITALPPGAVQLASAPACDIQAFRLGRVAWGLQFHIETTPEVFGWWADEDAALFADYDLAEIVRRAQAAHVHVGETWQPFAAAFAAWSSTRPRRCPAARCRRRRPLRSPTRRRSGPRWPPELASARAPLPMPGLRPD